ncbi:hypothetical protein T439DRAFT_375820 [Meredithblackwellia eburnea MCA 4105]
MSSTALAFSVTGAAIISSIVRGILFLTLSACRLTGGQCAYERGGYYKIEGAANLFSGLTSAALYGSVIFWALVAVRRVSTERTLHRNPSNVPAIASSATAIIFVLAGSLTALGVTVDTRLNYKPVYEASIAVNVIYIVADIAFAWSIVAWFTYVADSIIALRGSSPAPLMRGIATEENVGRYSGQPEPAYNH